jgi:hypothetical protein
MDQAMKDEIVMLGRTRPGVAKLAGRKNSGSCWPIWPCTCCRRRSVTATDMLKRNLFAILTVSDQLLSK